jgi:PKD repeat protein
VHSDPVRVTISATKDPTAKFTVSPTTPIAGTVSNFNASESKADTGHVIANYDWDFGDGSPHASGVTVQHTYALPSAYNVTLVVTDDTGRTGVTTQTVTAASSNPTATFSIAPQTPHTTDVISLDASNSSAVLGRVIVTYKWEFTGAFVGTSSGSTTSIGPIGGAGGTLTIKLTVTDSAGQVGILTKNLVIQP